MDPANPWVEAIYEKDGLIRCAGNNEEVVSIELGKEADLIILDRNLFDIPTAQFGQTKVMATYLQGELISEQ